jgi:hypothetical protein
MQYTRRNIWNANIGADGTAGDGIVIRDQDGIVIFNSVLNRLQNTTITINELKDMIRYEISVPLVGTAVSTITDVRPGAYTVLVRGNIDTPQAAFTIARSTAPGGQYICTDLSVPAAGDVACYLTLSWLDVIINPITKSTNLTLQKSTNYADGTYTVMIWRSDH